jgi:tetraacyldisaccharide 4'-kinase
MPSSMAMLDGLALIYGAAVKLRNTLYDLGVLTVHRVPPLVVSVGNIEAGGTGKTPFAMALAEGLARKGHTVAIVTRGYKGSLQGPVIVEHGHSSEEVGDEALLMARRIDLPIIKSPDRVKGALFARTRLGSEIIVLDDGFQHRRLHRDMDIVLVSRDIAREKLLPAGCLREPATSLARANIVVAMKGATHQGLRADLLPSTLVNLHGDTTGLELLAGRHVLAFCAIGKPGHFVATLQGQGAHVERLFYPDHHHYTLADLQEILDKSAGKDLILTTEKDLIKIAPAWFAGLEDRVFAVRVGIEMPGLADILDEIDRMAESSRLPG